MTNSHDIDRIIFLHLSGEADLEEIQQLRKWLNEDPLNKEVFENISKFWNESAIELDAIDKEKAYALLQKRREAGEEDVKIKKINYLSPEISKQRLINYRIMAAAVVLFVIAAAILKFSVSENEGVSHLQDKMLLSKQNLIGQKSTIKLPDGSTVWLNAGSTISYPKTFDSNERRITLVGEAFFDIQRDENRPFYVEVDQISISVLGTQFNVKAFPDEGVSRISLVSGKVKVERLQSENQHEPLFLEPGQEISYNKTSGHVEKQSFNFEYVTGWKDGILILQNDSFDMFTQKLRRWYGVDVEVVGIPTKNFIVTGKFQNENMENVLRTLQFGRDFKFTINDNLLTIKFDNM